MYIKIDLTLNNQQWLVAIKPNQPNLTKGMKPSYRYCYELNSTTSLLKELCLWHSITHKVWYAIKQQNLTLSANLVFFFFENLYYVFHIFVEWLIYIYTYIYICFFFLVSLFNGTSCLVCYLKLNHPYRRIVFVLFNSEQAVDKWFLSFLGVLIRKKMNVIARLWIEHVYNDVTV